MAKCSFCGEDKKLTKEHIWSNTLLRLFDPIAPLTIDEHRGIAHRGDPLLKDLCQECNGKMSPTDAAMRAFAEQHLTKPMAVGAKVEFSDPNLLRWAMKTVSNHERSLNTGSTWWQAHVGFFAGQGGDVSRVDLLLAPWEDLSPGRVLTEMMGVLALGAKPMVLAGLCEFDAKTATQQTEARWVLKVGSGVLALLVWRPDASDEVRKAMLSELRSYGWLLWGTDSAVTRIPFNEATCPQYHIPFHPEERDPVGQLKRLAEG